MRREFNYKDDLKKIIDYAKERNRNGDGTYNIQTVIKGVIPYKDFIRLLHKWLQKKQPKLQWNMA